jgi:hypothetical protein
MPVLYVTRTPPTKYRAAGCLAYTHVYGVLGLGHTECSREVFQKGVRSMQDLVCLRCFRTRVYLG